MRSTIDGGGRVVIPKAIREAMGLAPGQAVEVVYTDGRLEIDVAPLDVVVDGGDGLPLVRPRSRPPALDEELVRDTIEATRR
ncbi:MAG TPA: AbrB/MazE/SpoVT family DNA-binding domain-containing protein [Dermatophilaceae bacterium]|nr:AbrB/MazE/SpoVT family DNA-binding domain-containing protein [Dermatophilaceae bacterium]